MFEIIAWIAPRYDDCSSRKLDFPPPRLRKHTKINVRICHFRSPSQCGTPSRTCPARVHQNGAGRKSEVDLDRRGRRVNSKPGSDATRAFIDVHGGAWWCMVGWLINAPSGCAPASVDRETSLPARDQNASARRRRAVNFASGATITVRKQPSWVGFNWKFAITRISTVGPA